jgi:hypothetical protein
VLQHVEDQFGWPRRHKTAVIVLDGRIITDQCTAFDLKTRVAICYRKNDAGTLTGKKCAMRGLLTALSHWNLESIDPFNGPDRVYIIHPKILL